MRKDLDDLEQECQKDSENVKSWTNDQIRKWLTSIEVLFKKIAADELYNFINKGFYAWIHSKNDADGWKSVYEVEKDKVNNLTIEKTNLTDEKNQLTIERDGLKRDKQINELQLTNKENQINTLNNQITNKDNRIAQLDQTVKDSALIFQKQINVIDGLTSQLQQAQQQNLGNADYQTHLKEDLKRLAQERKDLVKQKKDLEDAKKDSENLRDQEITDLRTMLTSASSERDNLRISYNISQTNLTTRITELNSVRRKRDNRPNITLDAWNNDWSLRKTSAEFNNLQTNYNSIQSQLTTANNTINQKNIQINSLNSQITSLTSQVNSWKSSYNNVQNQLTKEQNWLDKWQNDRSVSLVYFENFPQNYINKFYLQSPTGYRTTYSFEKVIPKIKEFRQHYLNK